MALAEALKRGCERYPEKSALIAGDQTWSYARLDAVTDQIAARLLEDGVRPGDRVALHFCNCPELVQSYYACFKIGAIAVPLNVRLKGPELEYILNHSGARLYLGQHDLFPEVQSVRSGLSQIERFYLTEEYANFPDVRPFNELTTSEAARVDLPIISPDIVAAILYTSGTTAWPRGVTHTQRTLERKIAFQTENAKLDGTDVVAAAASMCHIAAFAVQMLPTLDVGATLLLISRFEPEAVLRAMEQHRVTQFFGLPTMYRALLHSPDASSADLRTLRWCLAGGDAVPTELQRRFTEVFGVELSEGCGMTELVPYCINRPGDERQEGSIGRPSAGVVLRIVDERGREAPPGEVGEIVAKCEATMIGYWNDPQATAAALKDGWLHTGDLGRMDVDGYYWFVGRKKEIIVRGGSNISPLEVEDALYQHPAVREAGVVGAPHDTLGEQVVAFVALREGAKPFAEELQQFLRSRLAAYKVPETITFLPELPKGLTGKIHRKTLRDWAAGSTPK
jgi:long-chain acyl-CoA synthetase